MDSTAGYIINIIIAIIILASIILNILLIIVLANKRKHKGWTLIDKLILAISIIDLIEGLFATFASIFYAIYGTNVLYEKMWYCQISGYINTSLMLTSISLLLLISMYRYLVLTKKRNHVNNVILYATLAYIGAIHIIGLLCLAFENFYPVSSGIYCYPSFQKGIPGILYYFIIVSFVFVAPIIFGVSYLGIFFTFNEMIKSEAYSSSENIAQTYKNDRQINSPENMSNDLSKKILFRTLIYIFLYLPIWSPTIISIIWDLAHLNNPIRPSILDVLSITGVALTILVNPIMVLLVHSKLLFDLLKMLRIKRF